MTDLGDVIEERASSPAKVSADGVSVDERPIGEIVEADKHLANKAARNRSGGLIGGMISKARHPGPA